VDAVRGHSLGHLLLGTGDGVLMRPPDEQIDRMVDRVQVLMDEWDDAEYLLVIRGRDNDLTTLVKMSARTRVVTAKSLLAGVLETFKVDG